MESLLIKLFFGHFIGDFFLQPKIMSDNKYQPGFRNTLWCSFHVLVYTLSISVFLGNFSPIFMLTVFVPHWIIDRFSLSYRWMKIIGRGDINTPFGPIVYVVIDQVMHFGCLYFSIQFK